MRTKVRTRLLKFTMAMEIVMAITILGAILASIALLICGSVEKTHLWQMRSSSSWGSSL